MQTHKDILKTYCEKWEKEINQLTRSIETIEDTPVDFWNLQDAQRKSRHHARLEGKREAKTEIVNTLRYVFRIETQQDKDDKHLEAAAESHKRQTQKRKS